MNDGELDNFTLRLSMLERQYEELKQESNKREEKLQSKLDQLNLSMIELLRFMSAQEERNGAAEKERDRIFKASTLLPVAILTSVISVGVNMLVPPVKSEPPTHPYTYTIPYREENRRLSELRVRED